MRDRRLACIGWALVLLVSARTAAAGDDHGPVAEPARVEAVLADSVSFAIKVTDSNLVGMTVTNYGFLGNNFISRSPSLEYPLGAGYEHLVRGGLWIGALAQDELGGFTGVSTGALDGSQGSGEPERHRVHARGKGGGRALDADHQRQLQRGGGQRARSTLGLQRLHHPAVGEQQRAPPVRSRSRCTRRTTPGRSPTTRTFSSIHFTIHQQRPAAA